MTYAPRKLEDLVNRATRYEVAIKTNAGVTIAAYMERINKTALMAVARDYSEIILAAIPADEDPEWSYSRADGLSFGPYATVYCTGRTERDAAA